MAKSGKFSDMVFSKVQKDEIAVQPPKPTLYQISVIVVTNTYNMILGLFEFVTIAFIMFTIIKYGYFVTVKKNLTAYAEAKKAIETINDNWKAALLIVGFILSRVVIQKIYELKKIGKDGTEFEKANK